MIYSIEPVSAPRQTRADAWKKRASVVRYREFRDACRAAGIVVPVSGASVTFVIPMPPSWAQKKRDQSNRQPHMQRPDLDNLVKALLDAIYVQDSGVWDLHARKVWGHEGAIVVESEPSGIRDAW